ncbi:MAG: zinc-ribbon domain containing protein [Thermoplasmata archaeon]|nr:MAG: zinc-ribbon domain containing protein [Thermoplasmata archaeon]
MDSLNKNEKLRLAAKEFAEKAHKLSSTLEIAVVGSVAGNDPYPDDIDMAIIIKDLNDIALLAKYARQMSSIYHNWDGFLFDKDLNYIGRICHRRECPGQSVECKVPGCGENTHIKVIDDFEFDEVKFFKSPIDVTWKSSTESLLISRKNELGIVETQKYEVLKDIELMCKICGATFVFTGAEQKYYNNRGFSVPRRCENCREKKMLEYID